MFIFKNVLLSSAIFLEMIRLVNFRISAIRRTKKQLIRASDLPKVEEKPILSKVYHDNTHWTKLAYACVGSNSPTQIQLLPTHNSLLTPLQLNMNMDQRNIEMHFAE